MSGIIIVQGARRYLSEAHLEAHTIGLSIIDAH
jgi:hypothetical protein